MTDEKIAMMFSFDFRLVLFHGIIPGHEAIFGAAKLRSIVDNVRESVCVMCRVEERESVCERESLSIAQKHFIIFVDFIRKHRSSTRIFSTQSPSKSHFFQQLVKSLFNQLIFLITGPLNKPTDQA